MTEKSKMSNIENNRQLKNWLLDKVGDSCVEDVYDKTTIKHHYGGDYDDTYFYTYYKKDDIDNELSITENESLLYLDEEELLEESPEHNVVEVMERHVIKNDDIIISHNPSSNIAHTSTLFKKMIDHGYNNRTNMSIPSVDATNTVTTIVSKPLIDVSMKQAFYQFCKDNTFE
jgi:hypothetical protein